MGTETATVEMLAAEVRTLMVGSRQVTLSVAKQLDVISFAEMETIFGRIKIGREGVTVIGRSRSGVLSISDVRDFVRDFVLAPRGEWGSFVVCNGVYEDTSRWMAAAGVGEAMMELDVWAEHFFVRRSDVLRLECGHSISEARAFVGDDGLRLSGCQGWWERNRDGYDMHSAEVESQVILQRTEQDRERGARNAPLIVLAGLR